MRSVVPPASRISRPVVSHHIVKVADMLEQTRSELDEFHIASKELEAELESELQRTERAHKDLTVKVAQAEFERDEWKVGCIHLPYRSQC